MDNIKCPKCGSEQISANKKGWTLTTGAIGMNKVILTCLKCGNQFRPGGDLETKNKKDLQRKELNAKIAKNPVFKIVFKIVFGLLALMILVAIILSIFDHSDNKNVSPTTSISDSAKSELDKYYVIEKEDNRTPIINLYVYVSINDSSKIKLINESLISKYNADSNNYLEISYFDKKGVGKIYQDKINNEKTSDKESDKLYSHMIADYSFNPSNGYVKLWFNHCK